MTLLFITAEKGPSPSVTTEVAEFSSEGALIYEWRRKQQSLMSPEKTYRSLGPCGYFQTAKTQ